MNSQQDRFILQNIAKRAMRERGLEPDFSQQAFAELSQIQSAPEEEVRDLTHYLWCSIDNDDSRDLDQLTVAEVSDGIVKIFVAIADVDAIVRKGSAIDDHARHNTTSVYTSALIFPMLPEKLSYDLTSLNFKEDRLSIVVEMQIALDGSLKDSAIYRGRVRNYAKLAYNSVAAWLEGNGPEPDAISAVNGLSETLHVQDRVAQTMRTYRTAHGALSLETMQSKPVFDGDQIHDLEVRKKNRASDIIEDFMICANGVTARFLSSRKFPSIRRVVRTPKRWDRIVQLAADHKYTLPETPDSKALDDFLIKQKAADLARFPDLSLSVIKLLGAGEYVAERPDEVAPGHFGLAVKDYAHSTAPNRRFPDLITQRLLKAAFSNAQCPYTPNELDALAKHCTQSEDAANKVERQVSKSAAALLFRSRIGEQFDTIVTGASSKGTWVRLLDHPVEGKLERGFEGLDVGDRVRVKLVSVDVDRGFIDFARA
jgi:VacB/RNase II family 3'-5' exoribonuclease